MKREKKENSFEFDGNFCGNLTNFMSELRLNVTELI